jgi:hypothetical protein
LSCIDLSTPSMASTEGRSGHVGSSGLSRPSKQPKGKQSKRRAGSMVGGRSGHVGSSGLPHPPPPPSLVRSPDEIGKLSQVRGALRAGGMLVDAQLVLLNLCEEFNIGGEALAQVNTVATVLGGAASLTFESAKLTRDAEGMKGIGGASAQKQALASEAAERRRNAIAADPTVVSVSDRQPLARLDNIVANPKAVGLVDAKTLSQVPAKPVSGRRCCLLRQLAQGPRDGDSRFLCPPLPPRVRPSPHVCVCTVRVDCSLLV